MKRMLCLVMLCGAVQAQEKRVMQEYKRDEVVREAPVKLIGKPEAVRAAPTKLLGKADYKLEHKGETSSEIENIIDGYKGKDKELLRASIDKKEGDRGLRLLKLLTSSMAMTDEDKSPITGFFTDSENSIECSGISIVDAAQSFRDGKTYLYLKFDSPGLHKIPDNFLNDDMRKALAIYTNNGREVAFYKGVAFDFNIRFNADKQYIAKWTIANDDGGILYDISCADRKFASFFMRKDGTLGSSE